MKMTYIDPSESIAEDIANIESNSGIVDIESEVLVDTDKVSTNSARFEEGAALIEEITAAEEVRAAELANYDTMTNTQLKDVTDLTSLDMTSVLDPESIDFSSLGIPDPRDYGMELGDVFSGLSSIDGTDWPLPKPQLSKVKPECFDLGDMYLSQLVDLSFLDMRNWDLPSFDFSFADEWGSLGLSDMFDMSGIDLSGIIDLTSVELPDWINPANWNADWDIDLSGKWDALKGIFDGMGSDGDLFNMGGLASMFNGINCVITSLVDVCSSDSIIAAIKNFSVPDIDILNNFNLDKVKDMLDGDYSLPDIAGIIDIDGSDLYDRVSGYFNRYTDDMPSIGSIDMVPVRDSIKGPVLASLGYLGDEWYWYDKSMGKYNYDALDAIYTSILWCLRDEPAYDDVYHAAYGFQIYSNSTMM